MDGKSKFCALGFASQKMVIILQVDIFSQQLLLIPIHTLGNCCSRFYRYEDDVL